MRSPKSERDPCEFQDELGDILRKTEVSFVCIVQTLWQCQVITQHVQRERGKVIGVGVHMCICLWTKKNFESYFRDRLTFSNIRSRTSR